MSRILCVCEQGNKRSVFTRFLLNHTHEALAIGVKTNSELTVKLLSTWADTILLAEPEFSAYIPEDMRAKIDTRFTIGPDIYPANITGDLKRLIRNKLKELEYI